MTRGKWSTTMIESARLNKSQRQRRWRRWRAGKRRTFKQRVPLQWISRGAQLLWVTLAEAAKREKWGQNSSWKDSVKETMKEIGLYVWGWDKLTVMTPESVWFPDSWFKVGLKWNVQCDEYSNKTQYLPKTECDWPLCQLANRYSNFWGEIKK